MIVEAELSYAAMSGNFKPIISASVAGSNFELEVCRDNIVGEVSIVNQPRLRFVIGALPGRVLAASADHRAITRRSLHVPRSRPRRACSVGRRLARPTR